ncbi:hypothetical protein RJ640_028138 [Escallonia rubra]|uniref:Uncharacterized protein n=1 Tax=Escallonia rubra TaxID=112253 RepID=A0AA88USQ9_9ASTE|nr:hypothetical protein RJ640_028138 [Escallonia rubra]
MDALDSVFDPLREFSKDSYRLVKRCHKPDRKGGVSYGDRIRGDGIRGLLRQANLHPHQQHHRRIWLKFFPHLQNLKHELSFTVNKGASQQTLLTFFAKARKKDTLRHCDTTTRLLRVDSRANQFKLLATGRKVASKIRR